MNLKVWKYWKLLVEKNIQATQEQILEKALMESKMDDEDIVITLCSMIDTYDMPTDVKFNSVIESALYGFESNGKSYKKSTIINR